MLPSGYEMGKRLLLFGPPGVGKGTHSKRLARELGIPHVATGDMLRQASQRGTALGVRADEFMKRGELVPDELVVDILGERLAEPDAADGYLLDGFPRTVTQAEALERGLATGGSTMDCVLSLEAPPEVLVNRLSGRFTCKDCGATYNRELQPPQIAGKCDRCPGALSQRPDDREEAVRKRLNEYTGKTTPVLAFFRARQWPIRSIASVGDVDEIYARIRKAVDT